MSIHRLINYQDVIICMDISKFDWILLYMYDGLGSTFCDEKYTGPWVICLLNIFY